MYSQLILMRALDDFFRDDRTEDNVVASDYFEESKKWNQYARKRPELLQIARGKINKFIAHLSIARIQQVGEPGFTRDELMSFDEYLEGQIKEFLVSLPEKTRRCFENGFWQMFLMITDPSLQLVQDTSRTGFTAK